MKLPSKSCVCILAVAAILSACNSKSTADKSASFTTEPIEWADSLTVGNASGFVQISAEYPVEGPAALLDATRSWIASSLACTNNLVAGVSKHKGNAKDLFGYVSRELLKGATSEDNVSLAKERPSEQEYQYIWKITTPLASDSCVTYVSDFFCYTGGAHGYNQISQTTFDAQGHQFTFGTMFAPDAAEPLRHLIIANLSSQYFKNDNIEDLAQDLLIPVDSLPLPSISPAFFPDGVRFIYGEYEIASYSSGSPTCTIPYSEIRPYLSPAAAAIIPR